MLYLLSHLWLIYLIALLLMVLGALILQYRPVGFLYAAASELVPLLGLWCVRRGYLIPAGIIAVLCVIAWILGVRLFVQTVYVKPLFAEGIAAAALCVLSVTFSFRAFPGEIVPALMNAACLCGMLAVVFAVCFVTQYFRELTKQTGF